MRKPWLSILLLAVIILTACSPKAAPTATSNTASPTRPAIPEGPAMACTVFSLFPDAKDPASVNLPPISAEDWSRGPDNAALTLIDYSDFQ